MMQILFLEVMWGVNRNAIDTGFLERRLVDTRITARAQRLRNAAAARAPAQDAHQSTRDAVQISLASCVTGHACLGLHTPPLRNTFFCMLYRMATSVQIRESWFSPPNCKSTVRSLFSVQSCVFSLSTALSVTDIGRIRTHYSGWSESPLRGELHPE